MDTRAKYWSDNLIIREMKILERYPSSRAIKVKSRDRRFDYQRTIKGIDTSERERHFLPTMDQYRRNPTTPRESYWDRQRVIDGDYDDDSDYDSVDNDVYKRHNQIYLPRIHKEMTPSVKEISNTEKVTNIPSLGNDGNYRNYYDKNKISTAFQNNEFATSNDYSVEFHQKYMNRNELIRQNAFSSDDGANPRRFKYPDKHLCSKSSNINTGNYDLGRNHTETKAQNQRGVWSKNTPKTPRKYADEFVSDYEDIDDKFGEVHVKINNTRTRRGGPKTSVNYVDEIESDDEDMDDDKHFGEEHEKINNTRTRRGIPGRGKATRDNELSEKMEKMSTRTNHKPALATRKNIKTKHLQSLPKTKVDEKSAVRTLVENNGVFKNTQKRILKWMSQNYGRVIDVFKKFDADNSGSLSLEEFYQGMKSLGAPCTQVELYMMAKALDRDEDETIDYHEFKKIKNLYKKSAPKHRPRGGNAQSMTTSSRQLTHDDNQLPRLQPCTKCCIGITEPSAHLYRDERHISVRMSSISDESFKKSSIGPFIFDVSPEMSIYGMQQLTKAELGGSVTDVRIFRKRDKKKNEVLEQNKKLGYYGYKGNVMADDPEVVKLFYDYTYPVLDCPLVSASLCR